VPRSPALSDQQVAGVLSSYAGMVDRVLDNPERWLGLDEDPPPSAKLPARALDALRDRAFGDKTPASPTWSEEPVQKRVDWWVTRIGISAGLAAAAPRFFGALANRLPVQSALGAAAAGLAVCATAREHGRSDPQDWVPLLGKVLFDRDLQPAATPVPDPEHAEQELTDTQAEEKPDEGSDGLTDGARRAARTLWRLARALLGVDDLLDHRPRGGRLVRLVAQVPVIGVASGWLDERGGIKAAARETTMLLEA
jgi:hypothetical protein